LAEVVFARSVVEKWAINSAVQCEITHPPRRLDNTFLEKLEFRIEFEMRNASRFSQLGIVFRGMMMWKGIKCFMRCKNDCWRGISLLFFTVLGVKACGILPVGIAENSRVYIISK